MVKLFFGLPGAGKTTLIAYFALKYSRQKGKRKVYDHIYSNVQLAIPGVTYIDNECIGKYDLSNSLILIDEATLFADSRAYKEFDKLKLSFFLQHRHYHCDIYLFTQQWDGVDRKIRVITDRVFYVYKGLITGKWFTCYYRIPYGIIIPDKKSNGEKLGEIIQGYCKPDLFTRIFSKKLFRPLYYKYFDSFDAPELPSLPKRYVAFQHKVVAEIGPEELDEELDPVSAEQKNSSQQSSDELDPVFAEQKNSSQQSSEEPLKTGVDVDISF